LDEEREKEMRDTFALLLKMEETCVLAVAGLMMLFHSYQPAAVKRRGIVMHSAFTHFSFQR
jgi:hypothetical protein